MRPSPALVLLLAVACGPATPEDPAATTGPVPDGTGDPSTPSTPATTGAPAVTTGPDPTAPTTTTTTTEAGSDAGESCGQFFTFDLSTGSTCDVLAQDCACGQKCAPVGQELHCVPLAADPVAPGEACVIDRLQRDDCDRRGTCVGPGFADFPACVPMCDVNGAGCPDDRTCVPTPNDTALDYGLCLHACDPLMPTCSAGEECSLLLPTWFADDTEFACLPEGDGHPQFSFCDLPTDCAPGLACVGETPEPCGPDVAFGCCTPYCDLDAPACPDPLVCLPWYDQAPPGLEHVGACLDAN